MLTDYEKYQYLKAIDYHLLEAELIECGYSPRAIEYEQKEQIDSEADGCPMCSLTTERTFGDGSQSEMDAVKKYYYENEQKFNGKSFAQVEFQMRKSWNCRTCPMTLDFFDGDGRCEEWVRLKTDEQKEWLLKLRKKISRRKTIETE